MAADQAVRDGAWAAAGRASAADVGGPDRAAVSGGNGPGGSSDADRAGPVIELRGVGKTYRSGSLEVEALRDVDLSIDDRELVAVVGPSGSGKSTLMHILGCLDVPTTGHYLLAGRDVADLDEDQLAEVRNGQIGFVFQQFNLLPSLPAWRNVELPLVYGEVDRAERRERAHAALRQVGLADRARHRPGELSGGQQQRVAVARALVTEPALLLADEPTGNLDSTSTADILGLLDALHDAGRTIVLITHEHDVARHADRSVLIRDGRLHDLDQALVGTQTVGSGVGS
jgi:ABC-type lipoprotein export system ATPase subunit